MSDNLIGLELVDGRVLYCHRSTLVNAGGLLAARFREETTISPGPSRIDEYGRNVYFIERDGELFQKHILPFIITNKPGKLPPYSEDPQLWHLIRDEAEFFGLDDLSEILSVTHSCPYSRGTDQGVLYWLGTDKGKGTYRNPQATGAIAVHIGKIGDLTFAERAVLKSSGDGSLLPDAFTQESRQALVQYRPQIIGFKGEDDPFIFCDAKRKCSSLHCDLSRCKIPTIVDLKSIQVRLTAYSLRYDECGITCGGMTDWNFEGSNDGEEWSLLHEARNDRHVAKVGENMKQMWVSEVRACTIIEKQVNISQEFAERELCHTWQIDPPSPTFFRFFRIIGSGSDYERHEDSSDCLHGVGLELYGEVREDFGSEGDFLGVAKVSAAQNKKRRLV